MYTDINSEIQQLSRLFPELEFRKSKDCHKLSYGLTQQTNDGETYGSTSNVITESNLKLAMKSITDATADTKGIVQLSNNYDGADDYKVVTEHQLNKALNEKTYDKLETTNKTMVGAVNEINSSVEIIWKA
jgi:hypothetical protein